MEWIKSSSNVRPPEYDFKSSKVYNYVRKNIEEVEDIDEETEEITVSYTYDELKVHKSAWDIYKDLEKAQADIDYLTMLTEDL